MQIFAGRPLGCHILEADNLESLAFGSGYAYAKDHSLFITGSNCENAWRDELNILAQTKSLAVVIQRI